MTSAEYDRRMEVASTQVQEGLQNIIDIFKQAAKDCGVE